MESAPSKDVQRWILKLKNDEKLTEAARVATLKFTTSTEIAGYLFELDRNYGIGQSKPWSGSDISRLKKALATNTAANP